MIDIRRCAYDPQGITELKELKTDQLLLLQQGGIHDITASVKAIAAQVFKTPASSPYKMALNHHTITVWDPQTPQDVKILKQTKEGWSLEEGGKITPLLHEHHLLTHAQDVLTKVRLAWKHQSPLLPSTQPLNAQLKKDEIDPSIKPSSSPLKSSQEVVTSSVDSLMPLLQQLTSYSQLSSLQLQEQTTLLHELNQTLQQLHLSVKSTSFHKLDSSQDNASLELDILPNNLMPSPPSHLGSQGALTLPLGSADVGKPQHSLKKNLEHEVAALQQINQKLSLKLQALKESYQALAITATEQTEEFKKLYDNYTACLKKSQYIETLYIAQMEAAKTALQEEKKQKELLSTSSLTPKEAPDTHLSHPSSPKREAAFHEPFSFAVAQDIHQLHQFDHFFTQLAQGKMLQSQLVGPVLINLAYLDPQFPHPFSEQRYTHWINSKMKTKLSPSLISSYTTSLKVHLGKYQKEKVSPQMTFSTLEKLSGYLSTTLQDKQLITYLADLSLALSQDDPSIVLQKHPSLAPKMTQLQDKITFALGKYQQLLKQSLTPTAAQEKKFQEAQKLSESIRIFLNKMKTSFNQTDWEVKLV